MRQPLNVPPRVRPGDTVAIVSPSFGAVAAWPHRVERGRAYLESLGLKTMLMPNADRGDGWASAPPAARADDIHRAFLDEKVAVVLASIGGDHSNQLLPHLDWDLIRSHPKIFQGYSDITVLHWAFLRFAGLQTLYGPALVPQLGEHPTVLPHTDRYLRAAWFGEDPLSFEPAPTWTDEYLDWFQRADLLRPRELRPSEGWVTIREGVAEGPILGGCLESICWHLKGSRAWLDLEGAVLVLETSEEAPPPARVDSYLTDLEQLGIFDRLAGLVIARPYGYDQSGRDALWRAVADRTRAAGIPVLGNVECGHADPMLTLPLGAEGRIDATAKSFQTSRPVTSP